MWSGVFAEAGATYEPPKVVDHAADNGCGTAPVSGWAGLYCPRTKTLVVDIKSHVDRHVSLGQGYGDQILGYVIAHEVGHHVQTLRGAPLGNTPDATIRRELQAECLAGVWAAAAGIALPPTWAYAEDAAHGTTAQQIKWLNRGYRYGRPADCDPIWAGAAL